MHHRLSSQLRRHYSLQGAYILALWVCSSWCLFPQTSSAQDRTYFEYRLQTEQTFAGTQVHILRKTSVQNGRSTEEKHPPQGSSILVFEFKRRAYGTLASAVASVGEGLERQNLRRSTLEGASILASEAWTDSTCALLFERHDSLFVGEISPSLTLSNILPILVSSTATSSFLANAFRRDDAQILTFGKGMAFACLCAGRLFWCSRGNGAQTLAIRECTEFHPEEFVTMNEFTTAANDPVCALLQTSGVRKELVMLSVEGKELWRESLDLQRRTILRRVSNYSVAACVPQGASTMVYIIRPKQPMLSTGINTDAAFISFLEESQRISAFALTQNASTGRYLWEAIRMPFQGASFSEILWMFPETAILPLAVQSVQASQNEFWCVFLNALYVMGTGTEPIASGRIAGKLGAMSFSGTNRADAAFGQTSSSFTGANTSNSFGSEASAPFVRIRPMWVLERGTGGEESPQSLIYALVAGRETLLFSRQNVPLWWLRNIVRDVWLYGALLLVLGIIVSLLYIVRYQRRLLITLFGAPGADAMVILDEEGKLESLNESARTLLNVAQEAPLRRLFQYYCVDSGALLLSTFAREALKQRIQATKPITFQKLPPGEERTEIAGENATEPHDYLFTAIPIQTRFGAVRGVMLIGKDITEELGKKKLGNWAQLAHDLQTNLAAIRLNAEKIAQSSMSNEGQKILYQVNLIIKRVRDIITIGKSEDLEKRVTDAAEICANVRKEFDENLFANVDFEVYAQHILFECDQLKLERALRNAVENGIRAMPESEGVIRIRAWFETGVVCFQVQDTGEGMSADVQKNMMRKGFTTFGSKGGSGMGTMIMKYIIQMHGGEMLIQSEKGKGTAVQFRIPARTAKHLHHLKALEISGNELPE
ncbi:MAG: PAS domain-containing sensor histidine kinase [Candidatus Kapaibacterium sp.]|nr:MAG: PAS domain-containing sensor histidine kinase [Candidatus Kapabacteria bacterium]